MRVLHEDDWQAWRAMRLAALAESPQAFSARLADWQGTADSEERWRARLAIPCSHNVVAALDGTPAGMVSAVPTQDTSAFELISMWVAPSARGRGVGDALIAEVLRWATTCGAHSVVLGVMDANAAARELYRRNGFRQLDSSGDGLCELRLGRALGAG